MSIQTKAPGYKEVADEAVFQLDCGREFTGWMFALMTAIRDDHKHSGGANSAALSNLGCYLSESHLGDAEAVLAHLNDSVASLGGVQ